MIPQRGVLLDMNSSKDRVGETSPTESTSTTTLPKLEMSSNTSPKKTAPIFDHVTRYNRHQKTKLWKQPAAIICSRSIAGNPSSRAVGKTTNADGRMTVMETPERKIGMRRLTCKLIITAQKCCPHNLQCCSYSVTTLVNDLANAQR